MIRVSELLSTQKVLGGRFSGLALAYVKYCKNSVDDSAVPKYVTTSIVLMMTALHDMNTHFLYTSNYCIDNIVYGSLHHGLILSAESIDWLVAI
jgi:hypothetical protein